MQTDFIFFSSIATKVQPHLYRSKYFFIPINDKYILSLQDDVQSTTAESPPSFKPPPPPGVHRRQSRREHLNKCPSSESSHSGLYFTAPSTHSHSREPGHYPASPTLHRKQQHPRNPSQHYTGIKTRGPAVPSRNEAIKAAQLSMVAQHDIGPFPRVQSPSRGPKPVATSPSPPPPPPLPAPPPPPPSLPLKPMPMSKTSSTGSKQQFVMVEVHRPNAEPDVNEVRPLPQARGENMQEGSYASINQSYTVLLHYTSFSEIFYIIPTFILYILYYTS